MFDVSEADVARIMSRVVSHRVRMRDGWMDDVLAGAVWGATFFVDKGGVERKPGQDGMEAEIGHGEATVLKDVLGQNSSEGVSGVVVTEIGLQQITFPLRSPTFTNYLHLSTRVSTT
jgi:hypothetical protein